MFLPLLFHWVQFRHWCRFHVSPYSRRTLPCNIRHCIIYRHERRKSASVPWIQAVLQFPAGGLCDVGRTNGASRRHLALSVIWFTHELDTVYFTRGHVRGPVDDIVRFIFSRHWLMQHAVIHMFIYQFHLRTCVTLSSFTIFIYQIMSYCLHKRLDVDKTDGVKQIHETRWCL